ncbi:hypothetical protein [Chitinophaga sp. HK235]|uniref:hypothetical protein n=1 Tax=Chitinophaga sp. HK235 TaxID=2952571 RepID=UPI001BAA072E|nr:hypothetical protein [Chitinophaga sp. HK235]
MTSNSPPGTNTNNHHQMSPQITEAAMMSWLNNQKEELKIRQDEMQLRRLEMQQNYELSKENLKLQGQYLQSSPKFNFQNKVVVLSFILVALLIVSGVFIYCVYLNKQEIAMRILEIITTAIISAGGGYALGKSKNKEGRDDKAEVME